MFNVVIKNGKGETLDTIECPVDVCSIGKARSNLVQLRGWRVAPQHAEIHRTSEGLFLERVSQKASVEVNGNAVDHYGPLRTSDQIYIAGYYLQVGELARRASADTREALSRTSTVRDDDDDDEDHLKTVIGVPRHAVLEESEALSKTLLELRHKDKFKWRNRVHEELLAAMDLRRTDISSMSEEDLRKHVKGLIKEIINGLGGKLPADVDHERLAKEVLDEAVGLGPLEDLLADETVTEIMVNKYDDIYIERAGRLTKSEVTFSSDDAVMSAIERIVSPLGRRIDESSPMVDARLKDGSRVNAIIPPLALRGPCVTIRKFSKKKLTADGGRISRSSCQARRQVLKS
jgi:pilus assembly protein CpaF